MFIDNQRVLTLTLLFEIRLGITLANSTLFSVIVCSKTCQSIGLSRTTNLTKRLYCFEHIKHNTISGNYNLTNFRNLTHLALRGMIRMENLKCFYPFTRLTSLHLWDCESLVNIDGLQNLTLLTSLHLWGCESLVNIDGLQNLTLLT